MATITVGTAGTTTLTGLAMDVSKSDADFASVSTLIRDDPNFYGGGVTTGLGGAPTMWSKRGVLYIPNRGWLMVFPGDIVAVGAVSNWPILISKTAAASADWVHT